MIIGKLDRMVMIQYRTDTPTNQGSMTTTWSSLASVWATVTYPTAEFQMSEGSEQGRETANTPVNFTIRYRTDVRENMRVLYDSEYYDIQRINKIGRGEMLKLVTIKKW